MNLASAIHLARSLAVPGQRTVEEWRGDTPDQAPPPRVRDRVLLRFERCCYNCGNRIVAGKPWTCDHIVAIINGGENRERNLGPLCAICTKPKDRADVGQKADTYRKRSKDMGLHKPKHVMPGSRASAWKKPVNGRPFRR